MQKIVTLLIFLAFFEPGHTFDRAALHQSRLDMNQISRDLLSKQYIKSSSAAADDIQISESTALAKFTQDNSSITSLSDNGWLVAFDDDRNGSKKIFFQRFDASGTPIGTNQLAASSLIGSNMTEPYVDTDSLGNLYLFFRNQTEGLLYFTKYDSDLNILIPAFLVNDTTSSSFAGPFAAAVYPNGKIVIVWENYSGAGSTIVMKSFNANGILSFGPITVNSDGGSASHWVPSVDVNPAGDILVAWEDYRNSRADIYIRLYNGAGSPYGSELIITPPPANNFNQYAPEVLFTADDQFIVSWIDERSGQEVYGQIYHALSGLIGSNILLSEGDAQITNWNIDLAKSPTQISLVWAGFGPQNLINRQVLTGSLDKNGDKIVINSSQSGRRWFPSIDYTVTSNIAISWSEFLLDHSDINLNLFDASGTSILSSELVVNDDTLGAPSTNPQATVSTDWYTLIAFEDERNDAGDIYVQAVSNGGTTLNNNNKVSQDPGLNLQASPDITANPTQSKSFVVWVDSRDISALPGQRIFGRFGSEFGSFTEHEFLVSDTLEVAIKKSPKAVMADNGNILTAWIDKRTGTNQIFGQWFDATGNKIGTNFQISTPTTDTTFENLNVVSDNLNRFYVTWLDKSVTPAVVKSQLYLADRSVSNKATISHPNTSLQIEKIATDVANNGDIILVYQALNIFSRLYIGSYATDGTELVTPFEILDTPNINALSPSVAVDNNDYISVCWLDTRNGKKEVYSQIYDNTFSEIGNNTAVSSESVEFMATPTTTADRGRAWFVWTDPRSDGLGIYANTILYQPTDINDNNMQLPNKFTLYQNYPNPFNPSTEIAFSVPYKSNVTITVYNMLGQHVKTLTDKEYTSGHYTVTWDGRNQSEHSVATGLYFYKLETDSASQMKKMLLLK